MSPHCRSPVGSLSQPGCLFFSSSPLRLLVLSRHAFVLSYFPSLPVSSCVHIGVVLVLVLFSMLSRLVSSCLVFVFLQCLLPTAAVQRPLEKQHSTRLVVEYCPHMTGACLAIANRRPNPMSDQNDIRLVLPRLCHSVLIVNSTIKPNSHILMTTCCWDLYH